MMRINKISVLIRATDRRWFRAAASGLWLLIRPWFRMNFQLESFFVIRVTATFCGVLF